MDRVLLVDDDSEFRETVASVLRDEGYEVIEAENGQQALRTLTTQARPSLVLLDLMMPGMKGQALVEVLRELGFLSELDIVVMTGSDAVHVNGARGVLQKPFTLAALLGMVAEFCEPPTQRDIHKFSS